MKKHFFILFFLLVFALVPELAEAQCAMCKASVESSMGQKNSVAANLNTGILYLMAVPYVLMAFIFRKQIGALWKTLRGKNVAEEEA